MRHRPLHRKQNAITVKSQNQIHRRKAYPTYLASYGTFFTAMLCLQIVAPQFDFNGHTQVLAANLLTTYRAVHCETRDILYAENSFQIQLYQVPAKSLPKELTVMPWQNGPASV